MPIKTAKPETKVSVREISIYTKIPASVKVALDTAAMLERRSLSGQISYVLCQWAASEKSAAIQDQDA